MGSRRTQKVAEAIRQVVSTAILTEMWDPRIRNVTVTYVEVSGDLRHAKIHVSVMGEDKSQTLVLRGLQHAAGFLQSKVAKQLELRFTPMLEFVLDQGVKRSIAITQLINELGPKPVEAPTPAEDAPAEDAPETP